MACLPVCHVSTSLHSFMSVVIQMLVLQERSATISIEMQLPLGTAVRPDKDNGRLILTSDTVYAATLPRFPTREFAFREAGPDILLHPPVRPSTALSSRCHILASPTCFVPARVPVRVPARVDPQWNPTLWASMSWPLGGRMTRVAFHRRIGALPTVYADHAAPCPRLSTRIRPPSHFRHNAESQWAAIQCSAERMLS